MTPLAQQIAAELTLPLKKRTFHDVADCATKICSAHCFECTEIMEAAEGIADRCLKDGSITGEILFLPADLTWIEHRDDTENGARVGWLLERQEDGSVRIILAVGSKDSFGSLMAGSAWLNRGLQVGGGLFCKATPRPSFVMKNAARFLPPLLAMINTPRIIGRRQYMPHRGLERDLVNAGMVGKFPLHAWTEIKLEVTPPIEAGDDVTEAHLTGRRAFHFCRAHLRIRLGRLELVSAHWRGDPALGIKQSRYKLTNSENVAGRV